jgi:hypothetical protein
MSPLSCSDRCNHAFAFPSKTGILAKIDTDADGVISEAEQRAYAERVLKDLSLPIDGDLLKPRLVSAKFPGIEEMKEGCEIQLEFKADVPRNAANRRLIFENRHQSRIAAYLVNCLAPRDPNIRVTAQNRNYQQSLYQLDYVEAEVRQGALSFGWWSGGRGLLGTVGLFLLARLAFLLCRHRPPHPARSALTSRG